MSKNRLNIGQSELELLQFVAEQGPLSVGEVVHIYGQEQGLARTTISTMMERLRKKGHLLRVKREGVFVYEASVTKSQLLRDLVKDFVTRTLGGHISPFFAYLSEDVDCTEEELASLKELVAQLEQEKEDG